MFDIGFDRGEFSVVTDVLSSRFERGAKIVIVPEDEDPIEDGGVFVNQMTKMQTYSIQFFIPQTGDMIERFETEIDEPVTIGLSWDRIDELVSKMGTDECTFRYNEDADKVQLANENTEANVAKLQPDSIHYADLPDIDYDCSFSVSLDTLYNEVDFCTVVDNDIYFQLDEDSVSMWAEGDTDDVNREIEPESIDVVDGTTTRLNGSDVKKMLKRLPNNIELQVEMKNRGGPESKNMPLQASGELFDGQQFVTMFAPGN